MALHGEIKINNQTIGSWSAVRQQNLADPDADYGYVCMVSMNGETVSFPIDHVYSDGATSLLAKIMRKAAREGL
jgi:hypothetical protein